MGSRKSRGDLIEKIKLWREIEALLLVILRKIIPIIPSTF